MEKAIRSEDSGKGGGAINHNQLIVGLQERGLSNHKYLL
jgi:hypothetical protein